MSEWLYRMGTGLYHAAIGLGAAVGVNRAKDWVDGRRQQPPLPAVLRVSPVKGGPCPPPLLWMHCASLGEWEQGRPVLEAFRKRYPDYRAVLTFFSPSGYERCRDEPLVDHVAYLPPDSPGNATGWLAELRPTVAVFVKYELWYYHLRALHRAGVPTFLVAAHFRAGQLLLRQNGGWYRGVLRFFTGIVVQQEPSVHLLARRGQYPRARIAVGGDPRVDRTLKIADQPFSDAVVAAFTRPAGLTIVAGSVWPDDLRVLSIAFDALPTNVRIILAPHRLDGRELARTQVRWKARRYTESEPEDVVGARVLLLDTIGMLSRVYRYGDVAYVGGGFRTGLHNTLEPLAYGLPTVFGPRHDKFPEAAAAIANGGAWSVADDREMTRVLLRLTDPGLRQGAADRQRALGRTWAGSADRTLAFLAQMIESQ